MYHYLNTCTYSKWLSGGRAGVRVVTGQYPAYTLRYLGTLPPTCIDR